MACVLWSHFVNRPYLHDFPGINPSTSACLRRSWDEQSEDGSICSVPETRQQCQKLKERCLLAEIKLLRSSMGAMKSSIQMEAAGRVGANTKIPYPREDYGQSKVAAERCLSRPDSLPSTGKQKASSDWEELDLRSNSPSATSVQECARLKLFSCNGRDGKGLPIKKVFFLLGGDFWSCDISTTWLQGDQ